MKKKSILALTASAVVVAFAASASAQNNSNSSQIDHELNHATQTIRQMTSANTTAGIPSDVIKNAKCIAVIPNLIQAGFIVGGRHGSGVATCRTSSGQWSPPAPFTLTGASFGAQIGGQSIGLVMMIMNNHGMQSLESGHFKVGAGVSAAAGPTGRQASASGGWNAAILTYSHSKGAYVGATVKGAELQQDKSATKALYGRDANFSGILNGQVQMPNEMPAQHFVSAVRTAVHHAGQTS